MILVRQSINLNSDGVKFPLSSTNNKVDLNSFNILPKKKVSLETSVIIYQNYQCKELVVS